MSTQASNVLRTVDPEMLGALVSRPDADPLPSEAAARKRPQLKLVSGLERVKIRRLALRRSRLLLGKPKLVLDEEAEPLFIGVARVFTETTLTDALEVLRDESDCDDLSIESAFIEGLKFSQSSWCTDHLEKPLAMDGSRNAFVEKTPDQKDEPKALWYRRRLDYDYWDTLTPNVVTRQVHLTTGDRVLFAVSRP